MRRWRKQTIIQNRRKGRNAGADGGSGGLGDREAGAGAGACLPSIDGQARQPGSKRNTRWRPLNRPALPAWPYRISRVFCLMPLRSYTGSGEGERRGSPSGGMSSSLFCLWCVCMCVCVCVCACVWQ